MIAEPDRPRDNAAILCLVGLVVARVTVEHEVLDQGQGHMLLGFLAQQPGVCEPVI